MRTFRMIAICAAVVFCGLTAEAAIEPEVLQTDGNGCVVGFDTSGCFGPTATATQGPTATKCVAYGRQNQGCRDCVKKLLSNGQDSGKRVCGYVTESKGCGCDYANTPNCNAYGSCTYY
jgi:hypothetical protein